MAYPQGKQGICHIFIIFDKELMAAMKNKILAAMLAGILPISFSLSTQAMAVEKNTEKTTATATTAVKADQKPQNQQAKNPTMYFGDKGNVRTVKAVDEADGTGALQFELDDSDSIMVKGKDVVVTDESGKEIVKVSPDLEFGEKVHLDQKTKKVSVVNESTNEGCTNKKWVHWGMTGAWNTLVCLPTFIGTAPATPLVQGAASTACYMAGDAMVTAIKC